MVYNQFSSALCQVSFYGHSFLQYNYQKYTLPLIRFLVFSEIEPMEHVGNVSILSKFFNDKRMEIFASLIIVFLCKKNFLKQCILLESTPVCKKVAQYMICKVYMYLIFQAQSTCWCDYCKRLVYKFSWREVNIIYCCVQSAFQIVFCAIYTYLYLVWHIF